MNIIKNKLYIYWQIGKRVYEERNTTLNIIEKCSNHYSYLFGNSYLFTRENIWFMEKFYKTFPIFNKELKKLTWNQYKHLLQINEYEERYFYYKTTLLFNYNYEDMIRLLNDNSYKRI